MTKCGNDISGEQPEPWADEIVGAADVVIIIGRGDVVRE